MPGKRVQFDDATWNALDLWRATACATSRNSRTKPSRTCSRSTTGRLTWRRRYGRARAGTFVRNSRRRTTPRSPEASDDDGAPSIFPVLLLDHLVGERE